MPMTPVDEIMRELRKQTVPQVQKIGIDIHAGIVNMTPVDTGRARGNWAVTAGSVSTEPRVDPNGSATIAAGTGAIVNGIDANNVDRATITLGNNLPYIERLENGWSDQAPTGMVANTLRRVLGQ